MGRRLEKVESGDSSGGAWIRDLSAADLATGFLQDFQRAQSVRDVVRGPAGDKRIERDEFVDDWDEAARRGIEAELSAMIADGQIAVCAVNGERIVGFATISLDPIGPNRDYVQLKELHVEGRMRGRGVGRSLFLEAVARIVAPGITRVYISSHSSVETVAFYKSLGCVDAEWECPEQVEREPCDYQLEYLLHRGQGGPGASS